MKSFVAFITVDHVFFFSFFTFRASPRFFKINDNKTRKSIVFYGVYFYHNVLGLYVSNFIFKYSSMDKISNILLITSADSSIVNEVIRGNFKLLLFFFFYDKILQAQKVQKDAYKQTKLKKTSKEKVTYSFIYVLCFLCS